MTPQQQIDELTRKIAELNATVLAMQNPNTITPSFAKVLDRGTIGADSKSASSENQVVNEGGSASYSVLSAPNGFDKALIGGVAHYYPYYT